MIHRAAATGFARSVEAYERARPEYPSEAIAYLARELDLRPGRTVVDLAAGTGKLSRPLAKLGRDGGSHSLGLLRRRRLEAHAPRLGTDG